MNPITQIQSQQAQSPINNESNKAYSKQDKMDSPVVQEPAQPVLNKMSKQLNQHSKINGSEITGQQAQQLIPNEAAMMIGAQSGNITAEFVANLLNKSPYEN